MKTRIAANSLIGEANNLGHAQARDDKPAIEYWEAQVQVYLAELKAEANRLQAERDEADRRAGAAERHLSRLQDDANARNRWLDKAKEQAGYDRNVSFDTVWSEILTKANSPKEKS